ncbi:MAG: polysaccharide deacetylase family protein [Bacteroidota bacterium]
MKNFILFICFAFTLNILSAQTNGVIATSSIKIEMLFPEAKPKALILSFDDGTTADRRLVKLMNEYGLKGTFHLNSNKLDTKGYITKSEVKSLFKGHEVSVHSANHPALTALSKIDIIYEVVEDRKELERLTGNLVRGMAYPFGNYNDLVVEAIKGTGIEYARTVKDSYNFIIPEDFLRWDPSIHQFGKAYFTANDSLNDKKELAIFFKLADDFVKSNALALFDVWGHSWENDGAGDRWTKMEDFFKMVSKRSDIQYTTQIDLVDYMTAFKNLKISVDKSIISNLSSLDVYVKFENKVYKIPAGSQVSVK